jgi:hypothetical protein
MDKPIELTLKETVEVMSAIRKRVDELDISDMGIPPMILASQFFSNMLHGMTVVVDLSRRDDPEGVIKIYAIPHSNT